MNKNNRKRIYCALLSLVLSAQLTACGRDIEKNSLNNIEYYKKYEASNDETKVYYKGENIVLAFDKSTNECKYYVYSFGNNTYNENHLDAVCIENKLYELYDINTENLIYYYDPSEIGNVIGYKEYDKILQNNIIVELKNIDKYNNDIEIKEWYTKEELAELSNIISQNLVEVKKLTK